MGRASASPSRSQRKKNPSPSRDSEAQAPSFRAPFSVPELIIKKRNGQALSESEIRFLIDGFVKGKVADYQMSALAMAIYFRGMSLEETVALTLAMRDSGRVIDGRLFRGRRIDKHSTGGVGDKVSICLAPLVAACGVSVPMVSGRGLGHTGGTLDKLESIPGFKVTLPIEQFIQQVRDIGCALIGQSDEIAPADKRLYALRDVTGTVDSIPLITASILSKKLAEGIDGLVLDVKVGRGAFMKTEEEARALAESIVRVGTLAGKEVTAVLSNMDAPLGNAIGNVVEAKEAIELLHGKGPEDLRELTLVLGAEMLLLARIAKNERDARRKLESAINDRSGLRVLRQVVEAQGGDPFCVDDPSRLPRAPRIVPVLSKKRGVVQAIDALEAGLLAVSMGAGRTRADQPIDPLVGIVLHKKIGDRVGVGDTLCELHLAEHHEPEPFVTRALSIFQIGSQASSPKPLVIDIVRKQSLGA
ncbi:MAG: thymidine phosphorylase [Sandaracinaceae bacterium]|nr:thymidine phosphorylase [Sandaracinaceae bacterium]MDW8247415.1 thymidine phosphorylase [Sandaracinaceae bacterium]